MEDNNVSKEVSNKYSLRGRVFNRIREDILDGKYKQNEALKETKISEELGVSRTPVREAIRQLELEGLITMIPNKGAIVCGIDEKDIEDIYSIRSLIEGLSAKWAAQNIDSTQIKALEEIIDLSEFFLLKGNTEQLLKLDNEFHEYLYNCSNSKILKHVLSDFHHYVQKVRMTSLASPERAQKSIEEHKAIVEAIRDGRYDDVETLTNKHVQNTITYVLDQKIISSVKR